MTEKRSIHSLYYFLGHLASGVDPVPGFEWLALKGFQQDRNLHLLHLLFSVPFGLYSMTRRLFTCRVEIHSKVLHIVLDLPMDDFAVRRSVYAVLRADHVSHLEGVTPYVWKSMPCNRSVKLSYGKRDLSCRGMTFVPPDGDSVFLDSTPNIAYAI